MSEELDYSKIAIGLQSVDFAYENLDFEKNSMPLFPFAPSWVPNNLSYAVYSLNHASGACKKDELQLWSRFVHKSENVHANIRASIFKPEEQSTLESRRFKRYVGNHDALGKIPSTQVYFGSSGQSVVGVDGVMESNIALKIEGAKLDDLGVGVYDILWNWEYQELEVVKDEIEGDKLEPITGDWVVFETSMHRIFVTIDIPAHPWTATPFREIFKSDFSKCPIWTEALIWACKWAKGAKSIEVAGKKIADGLFNNGNFNYGVDSKYTTEEIKPEEVKLNLAENTTSLDLSKVVERLDGGEGNGKELNCDDCAMIVAVLTNLLGGNLQVAKLQGSELVDASTETFDTNKFDVKPIRLIGTDLEESNEILTISSDHPIFGYHSVAWLPVHPDAPDFDLPDTIIFDACVQFDGDETKEGNPSASGFRLGDDNDPNGYRFKLATQTESGIGKCLAQPCTIRTSRVV